MSDPGGPTFQHFEWRSVRKTNTASKNTPAKSSRKRDRAEQADQDASGQRSKKLSNHREYTSWDLEPDTNTSPIMTIPGDSENVQVMRVQLAPADGNGVETTKGKRSKGTGPGGDTITVWNQTSKRKVSGNAAPMEKNLQKYLSKHPDCELYNGQDKLRTSDEKLALIADGSAIPPQEDIVYCSVCNVRTGS